jgi:hypothetical protein
VLKSFVERRPRRRRKVVRLVEDHEVEQVARLRVDPGVVVAQYHRRTDDHIPVSAELPGLTRASVVGASYRGPRRLGQQRAASDRLLELPELVGDLVANDPARRHHEHSIDPEQTGRQDGDQRLADPRRKLRSAPALLMRTGTRRSRVGHLSAPLAECSMQGAGCRSERASEHRADRTTVLHAGASNRTDVLHAPRRGASRVSTGRMPGR